MLLSRIAIIAAIMLSILVESCRKADDDPLFSLRTRKARVAGSWEATSAYGSLIEITPVTSGEEAWTYTGEIRTITSSFVSPTDTIKSTRTETYRVLCSFDQEGTFTWIEIVNEVRTVRTGTWNFLSNGGKSDKTKLILTVTRTELPWKVEAYTGANSPKEIFDIDELRHKKMVLRWKGSKTERGVTVLRKGEFVLEQE